MNEEEQNFLRTLDKGLKLLDDTVNISNADSELQKII